MYSFGGDRWRKAIPHLRSRAVADAASNRLAVRAAGDDDDDACLSPFDIAFAGWAQARSVNFPSIVFSRAAFFGPFEAIEPRVEGAWGASRGRAEKSSPTEANGGKLTYSPVRRHVSGLKKARSGNSGR